MDDSCRDDSQVVVVAGGAVVESRVVAQPGHDGGRVEGYVAAGTPKVLMRQTLLGTHLQDEAG